MTESVLSYREADRIGVITLTRPQVLNAGKQRSGHGC